MRKNKTVSLSMKEFQHARKKMLANDWARDGDDEGISRYVQELIRADMEREARPKLLAAEERTQPAPSKRRN